MSATPRHGTALTADGLTVCCEEDPRAVEGGFTPDPGKVTCTVPDPGKREQGGTDG